MVRPATYPENSFLPRDHHDSYPYISTDNSTAQCGRYVLISGASKGVGRSMAISFAKAGASGIALLARSSLDSTKTAVIEAAKKNGHEPPTVLALNVDIADRAAVEGAAAKVKEVFRGKLDLVINNAGYLMDRTFIPLLLAAGGEKTLITVTSAGAWVTFPGGSGYQGSKTAVVRLNNHIHAEYAEKVGALFQVFSTC